jgi:D-3-phosphoglycerate dehydrogenase
MSKEFTVVLIASDHSVPGWVCKKYKEARIHFRHHECYTREDLQQHAWDAHVLWLMSSRKGLVVEENMDVFKKAGVAIKCGSGTDNIDHAACTKHGIIVAHTPEDPVEPASDHAIALLLSAIRQIAKQDHLVRQGILEPLKALPLGGLTNAEVGIIGFGRIGRRIAQKLSGFEVDLRVFDPYLDREEIEAAGGEKVELNELLQESQYVFLQCPLNEETRGLIGQNELQKMRPDSILVNNARSGVVVQKELVEALRNGQIQAAALDTFDSPESDGLLSLESVVLTPHLGGWPGNYPYETFRAVVDVIVDVSRMKLPKWIVNKGVVPKWKMTANTDRQNGEKRQS